MSNTTMDIALKECSKCHEEKTLTSFYRSRKKADGRQSECSICQRAAVDARNERLRRELGDQAYREMMRSKQRKWRTRQAGKAGGTRQFDATVYAIATTKLRNRHRTEFEELKRLIRYELTKEES